MDDNRRCSTDKQSPITGAAANDHKLQRNRFDTSKLKGVLTLEGCTVLVYNTNKMDESVPAQNILLMPIKLLVPASWAWPDCREKHDRSGRKYIYTWICSAATIVAAQSDCSFSSGLLPLT